MASHGVADGVPRDDAGASREVAGFFGKVRSIPRPHSLIGSPVHAYYSGANTFSVTIGEHGAAFEIWTDVRGMEAMIESLQSVLVRARIAREAAGLPAPARFVIPPPVDLDTEVPW